MLVSRFILSCALTAGLILGCNDANQGRPATDSERSEIPKETAPPKADSAPLAIKPAEGGANAVQAGAKLPDPLRGTVKETLGSGGYTYMLLGTEHGDVWAAARKFSVSVGEPVELAGMMPMFDFRSPTLDRTFAQIQFVASARVIGDTPATGSGQPDEGRSAKGMPPGHPPVSENTAVQKPAPLAPPKAGDIEALSGGVTVVDLFNDKVALRGKTVKFRGRVVKANRGILGKNWLHIQDGTGAPGSNNITVTSTSGFAPPGSLVIIEGTLTLDKDFGAGYAYDVIVEDASVLLEPRGPSAAGPATGKTEKADPADKPAKPEPSEPDSSGKG